MGVNLANTWVVDPNSCNQLNFVSRNLTEEYWMRGLVWAPESKAGREGGERGVLSKTPRSWVRRSAGEAVRESLPWEGGGCIRIVRHGSTLEGNVAGFGFGAI